MYAEFIKFDSMGNKTSSVNKTIIAEINLGAQGIDTANPYTVDFTASEFSQIHDVVYLGLKSNNGYQENVATDAKPRLTVASSSSINISVESQSGQIPAYANMYLLIAGVTG